MGHSSKSSRLASDEELTGAVEYIRNAWKGSISKEVLASVINEVDRRFQVAGIDYLRALRQGLEENGYRDHSFERECLKKGIEWIRKFRKEKRAERELQQEQAADALVQSIEEEREEQPLPAENLFSWAPPKPKRRAAAKRKQRKIADQLALPLHA